MDLIDHNTAEVFESLVGQRRSVRGFLRDPVPDSLLRHVLGVAQRTPSNCNVQPWVTHIVSGDTAAWLKVALVDAAAADAPLSPDISLTAPYPGPYRARQIDAAKALFTATGVPRDDPAARRRSFLRNFQFFDAPHAAFVFLPEWAGMREAADCGMYAQTLMLALTANGLASCAQGALSHYAEVVRRELGVGRDLRLLFGLSFGYEDPAAVANTARTDRAAVDDAVTFHM